MYGTSISYMKAIQTKAINKLTYSYTHTKKRKEMQIYMYVQTTEMLAKLAQVYCSNKQKLA
jgi:hypothetical protein